MYENLSWTNIHDKDKTKMVLFARSSKSVYYYYGRNVNRLAIITFSSVFFMFETMSRNRDRKSCRNSCLCLWASSRRFSLRFSISTRSSNLAFFSAAASLWAAWRCCLGWGVTGGWSVPLAPDSITRFGWMSWSSANAPSYSSSNSKSAWK